MNDRLPLAVLDRTKRYLLISGGAGLLLYVVYALISAGGASSTSQLTSTNPAIETAFDVILWLALAAVVLGMVGYLFTLLVQVPSDGPADRPVDEPVGAKQRHSLGMTLWHLAHNASMIQEFYQFVYDNGYKWYDLLPASVMQPPADTFRLLLKPELLPDSALNGWERLPDGIQAGRTDPRYNPAKAVDLPLHIERGELYRLWVQFYGWTNGMGTTGIRIYRQGHEGKAPLMQGEVYDIQLAEEGESWKDFLVDLQPGDYTIRLSPAMRDWFAEKQWPPYNENITGFRQRRIKAIYLTDEIWAEPPTEADLVSIVGACSLEDIQYTCRHTLTAAERDAWEIWRLRPVSWEERHLYPQLFQVSRDFWREKIEELAQTEYAEDELPDYRAPDRQIIFDDDWNMVANPVRIARQIGELYGDILPAGNGHAYHWLYPGTFQVSGKWEALCSRLQAPYGDVGMLYSFAEHQFEVELTGEYVVWIRSENLENRYAAWRITVEGSSGDVIQHDHDQNNYPDNCDSSPPCNWTAVGPITAAAGDTLDITFSMILPDSPAAPPSRAYRRIYDLVLTTDPNWSPAGTTKPPVSVEQYLRRAERLGTGENDYILWAPDDPYSSLAQDAWPGDPPACDSYTLSPEQLELVMARDTYRSLALFMRNVSPEAMTFNLELGPLSGEGGSFEDNVDWRVIAFAPYDPFMPRHDRERSRWPTREHWTPFMLLRRPYIIVPPWNVAGIWLTIKSHGLPPGEYTAEVTLRTESMDVQRVVRLNVSVSTVEIVPATPVLVSGWTIPPEGDEYMQDFVDHGLNVWPRSLSRQQMQQWGIELLLIQVGRSGLQRTRDIEAFVQDLLSSGLHYDDFVLIVLDEPTGIDEDGLAEFIEVASNVRNADPNVRIGFNPGEAAKVGTFLTLQPYADFWIPYILHLRPQHADRQAIFTQKPYMWYTTPVYRDKWPVTPQGLYEQIRSIPTWEGPIRGYAFFAFNYPFRDAWDTAYESIRDAGVTVLPSRHGPVPTRTWEAIREAIQHANLAQMVKETDPGQRELIVEGDVPELIAWLEASP